MVVSDIVNFARILLANPNTSPGRWSDASLIVLADRALKHVVGQIYFPESRLTWVAVPQQQLFALPEVHCIRRVYMSGQALEQTTIDVMEGRINGQGGVGSQGTPAAGSDAPSGTNGIGMPNWAVQTPVAYPFINAWQSPAPYAPAGINGISASLNTNVALGGHGGFCGAPKWYLRGGSIGITPMPLAGSTLVVDCVRIPTTLAALSDTVVVPDNFMDAIAWKICEYAGMADSDPRAMQQAAASTQAYMKELGKLRTWVRQYSFQDGVVVPMTYRNAYRIGGNRA